MEYGASTHPRRRGGSGMADSVSDASRLVNATLGRDALTERSRRTWSAGDYDRVSEGFREEARAFVERLSLRPGQLVLDAACGSGNLTIPAARTGVIAEADRDAVVVARAPDATRALGQRVMPPGGAEQSRGVADSLGPGRIAAAQCVVDGSVIH